MLEGEAEPNNFYRWLTAGPIKRSPKFYRLLEEKEAKVARIFCRGGYDAAERYRYQGIKTCAAANQLEGGVTACDYGCLRYYTCRDICPFDAIYVDGRGDPVVDPAKCRTCGLCVRNCPRHIIRLVPKDSPVDILCSSHSRGKDVVKLCRVGCIGCGKCVKECPVDAIRLEDNLARIDYAACIGCPKCVEVCPRNTIRPVAAPKDRTRNGS